jgi:PAS domain S-box-containing protein
LCIDHTRQEGRLIEILWAIAGILAIALLVYLKAAVYDRFQQLKAHALKRLQGEPAPIMQGEDDFAVLDSAMAALSAQRSWAMFREGKIASDADRVVSSLDENMDFTAVGASCSALWAYPPADLIGKSLADYILDSDLDRTYRRFDRAKVSQTPMSVENRIICGDGIVRDMIWSIEWSDKSSLYSCVAQDITERKNLERLKDEFFAMVTHDLRTPLTSLKIGIASLLTEESSGLSATAMKNLSIADEDISRLIRLISDLLDWEKLGAPNFSVVPQPTSVGPIVHNAIATLSPLAEQKELTFTVQMKEQQILADPERLMQVVTNLLSNAIKFAPEGSEVHVGTQDQGEWLDVRISDAGPGIPSEMDSGIFEPFKENPTKPKNAPDGTGLGLAICRRIIHAHGGRIGFIRRPEGGTTFWFRLRKVVQDQYSHPVLK